MSDEILDAARTVFEQFGARRANVDDVARVAKISRSTLYRRFPNKDELLAAVIQREMDRLFDQLIASSHGLALDETVVECFTRGVRLFDEVPVIGRLAQTEPESLTLLNGRDPDLLMLGTQRVASTLRHAGATLADDDLMMASEVILRLASSFLLTPAGLLDLSDEASIRSFAWRHVVPLVHPSTNEERLRQSSTGRAHASS